MRVRRFVAAVFALTVGAIAPGHGDEPQKVGPASPNTDCPAWLAMGGAELQRPSSGAIYALATGPFTSVLWVATSSGLSRLYDGSFKHIDLGDQALSLAITEVGVAAATNGGLYWVDHTDDAKPRNLENGRVTSVVRVSGRLYYTWVKAQGTAPELRSIDLERGAPPQSPKPQSHTNAGDIRAISSAGADVILLEQTDRTTRLFKPTDPNVAPSNGSPLALLAVGGVTVAIGPLGEPLAHDRSASYPKGTSELAFVRLAPSRLPDQFLLAREGLVERWELKGGKLSRAKVIKLPTPIMRVTALAEDGAGRIFVGTEDGLMVTDPARGRSLACPNAAEKQGAPSMAAGFMADGRVWFSSGKSLTLGASGQSAPPLPSTEGRVVYSGVGGKMFAATSNGISWLDGGQWKSMKVEPAAARNATNDRAVLKRLDLQDGLLSLVLEDDKLRRELAQRYQEDRLRALERSDGLLPFLEREVGIERLGSLLNNEVVVAAGEGMFVTTVTPLVRDLTSQTNERARLFSTEERTPRDLPLLGASRARVAVAGRGGVLVLTQPAAGQTGLLELSEDMILRPLPLPSSSPAQAFSVGEGGSPWLITDDEVWERSSNAWTPLLLKRREASTKREEDRYAEVLGVAQDEGDVLVLCPGCKRGSILSIRDGKAVSFKYDIDPLNSGEGAVLKAKGAIWVAFGGKLYRKMLGRGQRLDRVEIKLSPSYLHITSLVEAGDGAIWAVHRRDEDKLPEAPRYDLLRLVEVLGGMSGQRIPLDDVKVNTLTLAPVEGHEGVWIGGEGLLQRINNRGERTDKYPALQEALRDAPSNDGSPIKVLSLADGPGGLLALADRGLLRLSEQSAKRVTLAGLPKGGTIMAGNMAQLSNGDVVIAAVASKMALSTNLWRGDQSSGTFELTGGLPFQPTSIAPGRDGNVLYGGVGMFLSADAKHRIDQLALQWRSIPIDFAFACAIDERRMLVLTDVGAQVVERSPADTFRAEPSLLGSGWRWCSAPSKDKTKIVVASDNGLASVVTLGERLSSAPLRFEGDAPPLSPDQVDRVWAIKGCPSGGTFILDSRSISRWDEASGSAQRKLTLPEVLRRQGQAMSIAFDGAAAWVGTSDGLWRAGLDCNGENPGDWRSFDVLDGLPSQQVQALVRYKHGVAAFTPEGTALVSFNDRDRRLVVERARQVSINGRSMRAAELFSLSLDGAKKRALAVGTEAGVSFLLWDADQPFDPSRPWIPIDLGADLRGGDAGGAGVTAIHWAAERLWITTTRGVGIFKISQQEQKVSAELEASITAKQGLPQGVVRDAHGTDTKNVWVLVQTRDTLSTTFTRVVNSYRVARLALANNEPAKSPREGSSYVMVATTEPFLFSSVLDAKLGPVVEGHAPALLVRDNNGWSHWSLDTLVAPKLDLTHRLFWATVETSLTSVDPTITGPKRWEVRYYRDTFDGIGTPKQRWWITDFWTARDRNVIAQIKTGTGDVHWVAGVLRESRNDAALRVLLFALSCALIVGVPTWQVRRYLRRMSALRARFMPYVEGGAVSGPGQFFGRGKLIETLRDSIATTSWFLTGEFRCGKTSIQRELGRVLAVTINPKYVYFPVFIDLSALGDASEGRFFYLIGARVLDAVKRRGCPEDVLGHLEISKAEAREEYDAISLTNDLESLLAHYDAQLAPQKKQLIIVLQIDEAGVIHHLSSGARLEFRSIFNTLANVRTVLSARLMKRDLERGSGSISPWWNIFKLQDVEPLTPAEARELIVKPVQGIFVFDETVIQRIIARSEGRPLAVQRLCADILRYKYASGAPSKRVTPADLDGALASAQTTEQPPSSRADAPPGHEERST